MDTLLLGIINEPVTKRNDDYSYTSLINYDDKNPEYIPVKHVDPIVHSVLNALHLTFDHMPINILFSKLVSASRIAFHSVMLEYVIDREHDCGWDRLLVRSFATISPKTVAAWCPICGNQENLNCTLMMKNYKYSTLDVLKSKIPHDATVTDLQCAHCGCTNIFSPNRTKSIMSLGYRTVSTEMTGFNIVAPDYSIETIDF